MRRYTVRVDGTPFLVDVEETAADRFTVAVGDRTFTASLEAAEALPGSEIVPGVVAAATGSGAPHVPPALPAQSPPPAAAAGPAPARAPAASPSAAPSVPSAAGATVVAAPMPGVILEVHVAAGAQVGRGDPLCVLEAMKMRNTVRAPRDAVVTAVHVEAGRPVLPGEPMLTLGDAPR